MDRRRTLIIVAALMATGMGGRWVWDTYVSGPLDKQRKAVAAEKRKLDQTNQKVVAARLARLDLEDLSQFCLPGDLTIAQDKYQGYLVDLFEKQGVIAPSISPGQSSVREGLLFLSFTVQGSSSMAALRDILHHFYATPRLQQISRLSLTPIAKADTAANLRFSLTTEVVAYGEDAAKEPSADSNWEPRVAKDVESYDALVYKPLLSATGDRGGVPANSPMHVALVSILLKSELSEAEIYDRGTNRARRLTVGQRFTVGPIRARVLDVGRRDAVLLINEKMWLWPLGLPLSQRRALPVQEALDREIELSRFRDRPPRNGSGTIGG